MDKPVTEDHLMGDKNSIAPRPKLTYSVNTKGRNKDWIYQHLTDNFVDEMGTIDDLKTAIKSGYAISPSHYGGKSRCVENAIKAGLLLVDVDNGWTIEQAKSDPFIQQYCLLTYTSSSHTQEHHKFRLIFALSEAVDALTFSWLVKELLNKFPHDPSPKSVSNAFYGNTEAIFFIENPDAVLPLEWNDLAIANAQAEKEALEKKTQERQQYLKDNPPHIAPGKIPLTSCCRKEVRNLIDSGVPAGSGHNDGALSVIMELLAVERYLEQIGQPYSGSASDYYDRFLIASGVDDGKAKQRWEWAEGKQDLDTSLEPDAIQNCIYAYEFSPLKTPKERDQYRKDHPKFKPIHGDYTNQSRGNQESKHQENFNSANEAGNSLSEKLSALLDIDGNIKDLLEICKQFADDIATNSDPITELKDWIHSEFSGYTASSKRLKAIQFAAAVCHGYGDRVTNLEICQLIQSTCNITRINVIQDEFKEALRIIDPPIPATQKALQAVNAAYGSNRIKFNELSKKVEMDGQEMKDIELVYMSDELSQYELYKMLACDAILVTAKKNKYNPVIDYLDSVKDKPQLNEDEWNNLAEKLLGTRDQLAQIILRKALIAAVARAYNPGCYVRMILVLCGDQLAGKSTFLLLLAGGNFFCDSLGKEQNKDDYQLLHSYWVHEWSEIDKLNKKSAGEVKAFITKVKDDFRAPYARAPETHKRACVIFGTCNRRDFLKDSTGNTRFSVIEVKKIDLELVKELRDSIWATARARYFAGEQWELTQAEQALSEVNNHAYSEQDPWLEDIEKFIEIRSEVTLSELFDHLQIEKRQQDSLSSKRIRDCLSVLGWHQDNKQTRRGGIKARRWRPASSLPTVSEVSHPHQPVRQTETPTETPEILIQQEFQPDVSDVSVKNSKTFFIENCVLTDEQPTIQGEMLGVGDLSQEKVGKITETSETPAQIPCPVSDLGVSVPVSEVSHSCLSAVPITETPGIIADYSAKQIRPYPQTDITENPEAEQRLIVGQLKSATNQAELTRIKDRWNESSLKWIYNYRLTAQEKLEIQSKAKLPLVSEEVNYA